MPVLEEDSQVNNNSSSERDISLVKKADCNLRKLLLEDTFDVAPTGLTFCFDRELFLNDDFNSDDFILEQHCRGISLERLRDDLLQYSNILKSSLIELINQDYADFVSLSTNLVGLDKSINTIAKPLKQLQSYISSVLKQLESVDEELSTKLKSLQQIKNEKDFANSLFTLDTCVSRLERWLTQPNQQIANKKPANNSNDNNNNQLPNKQNDNEKVSMDANNNESIDEWPAEFYADCSLHEDTGQRMDRVANEYIKLQFFVKKCRDHPILNSLKSRIHWITVNLQEQLETRLKEGFETCGFITATKNSTISRRSVEQLRQVISIYLAIDKLSDLMLLYRKYVLHDKLSQIFIPRPELTHAGSDIQLAVDTLNTMYTNALEILDSQLCLVKEHIIRCSVESSEPLCDFDCLVEGFWPETIDLICENLPEIFSPGHPDRFYSLYSVSMHFVESVEAKTWSHKQLNALRNHASYSMFINKWSLPVYFQIRFQEIAANVENVMKNGLKEIKSSEKSCLLDVTETVISQIDRCWQKGIYVDKLMHRFWKLTLQIISRYSSFIDEQIKSTNENSTPTSSQLSSPDTSINSSTLLQTKPSSSSNECSPELLIFLLVDSYRLIDYIHLELKEKIFTCLNHRLKSSSSSSPLCSENEIVNCKTMLTECLEQSCERLTTSIDPINNLIIERIQQNCSVHIRQVLDIPRQYRWTNRDFATTPSSYVSNLVNPLKKFSDLASNLSKSLTSTEACLTKLLQQCVTKITNDYTIQLSEVSTSVRKMEDSLRRLREVRRGSVQTQNANGFQSDDKIRHQLYLDAKAYSDEVKKLWNVNNTDCTNELDTFIEQIDNSK
ncbi:unnamed protein product [Trichobilharzia szidati]|nr:unnamed protein product [Trichobilharzia szidati]